MNMENIFKDCPFGTVYITKNGKRVILSACYSKHAFCLVEDIKHNIYKSDRTFISNEIKEYRIDGICLDEPDLDIMEIYNENFIDKEMEYRLSKSFETEYNKIANWKGGILLKIYHLFN